MNTPLAAHFKLLVELSPYNAPEEEYMKCVPYTSTVGSLMYVVLRTRSHISQAVSVVNRYMDHFGKVH